MRHKMFLLGAMLLVSGYSCAQMMDDFSSNQLGWSEISSKRGKAGVINGVLHLETKAPGHVVTSTCYAPFDFNKPFVLTCDALAKKVDDDRVFGILLDYEDDNNYILFYMCEGEARLERYVEGRLAAKKFELLKLQSGRRVGIEFEVDYNLTELVFKVNGVKSMSYRRRLAKDEYMLGTSGIGFLARDGQVIDFDNLKIVQ